MIKYFEKSVESGYNVMRSDENLIALPQRNTTTEVLQNRITFKRRTIVKILVWLVCFLLNSLNANQIVAKQNKTDRQLILIEVVKNEPKDGKYQVVGPFISNSYAIALVMYKE